MTNDRQQELDEQSIDEREAAGEITPQEANKERREIQRAYAEDAREACEGAYDRERENW